MKTTDATFAYSPKCPHCGAESVAPVRAGMSSTPYKCTGCARSFGLVFGGADVRRLAEVYSGVDAGALLTNCNIRVRYPQ